MTVEDLKALVGKKIRIISMDDAFCAVEYADRTGVVERVDDAGQLHGSWGGLAVIPGFDEFEVIDDV